MTYLLINLFLNSVTLVLAVVNNKITQTHHFCARQHICYSAYMLTPVRLSPCLSVRHTGGSVKDG